MAPAVRVGNYSEPPQSVSMIGYDRDDIGNGLSPSPVLARESQRTCRNGVCTRPAAIETVERHFRALCFKPQMEQIFSSRLLK